MTKETELPDVFLWANKTDGRKDKLGIELFAITKSSEIFRIDHNEAINHQLFALFLYDIISGVQVDSITGVRVVDYATSEGCQNTLPAIKVNDVPVAEARKNGKILDERLSIATPTIGQGIEFLCKDNRTLVKRLAKLDPANMTRDAVEEIIRDYNVDLMTDATNDKLIIMDTNDAKKLLDIVEDNFVRGTNGTAYIAKNKKELEPKEDK